MPPRNRSTDSNPAMVTWHDNASYLKALATYGKAIDTFSVAQPNKITASHYSFKDITSTLSARDPYTRRDYETFRPDEAIPRKSKEIMAACMSAYHRVGLVRNVIDLMGDFACQGVTITHPNKAIERFFNSWFDKVNGKDRSERFLNLFYRVGNIIIKRSTAKINAKNVDNFRKSIGAADLELETTTKPPAKEIPWRYTFLNPLTVDVIGEELALFAGKRTYVLKVNNKVKQQLKNNNSNMREIIADIPKDLKAAIISGNRLIQLPMDKIVSFFYKKDDWQVWANPMIYAILDDLILLEKLKLADLAAADGALSHVRVWKLGDLKEKILPSPVAVDQLASIFANNVGGGSIDLVWGPDIDLIETKTDISFLGSEKYGPVLNSIYAGLGIPPTLTGSATSSGFTNNFISLKTLVERLEYGRTTLKRFWEQELELVRQAMNFRFPARIQFDRMTLSDEAAEKALMIQLVDRNLISMDTVLQRFGEMPELEKLRMKRESRDRDNNQIQDKLGPYTEKDHDLSKIALQRGLVTPTEIGMNLLPRKPGEKTPNEMMIDSRKQMQNNQKGQPQKGRPFNSKDGKKRKQKEVKPRTSVSSYLNLLFWTKNAAIAISDIITPAWLKMNNKKDVRSLTTSEFSDMENIKFGVLCNIEPYSKINDEKVYSILDKAKIPTLAKNCYNQIYQDYIKTINHKLNINDIREIQEAAYALYKVKENQDV